jgi:hypothetical protein
MTCTPDTSKSDVELFMERCTRDPDNQYIIMGYDHLKNEQQDIVISKIE